MKIYMRITIVTLMVLLIAVETISAGEKVIFGLWRGTEPIYGLTQFDNHQCFRYQKFLVATKPFPDRVGSVIYVKYNDSNNKFTPCEKIISECDFKIKNETADYFEGIYEHYLFIDQGTGPDPRGLIIYNLYTKKIVFDSEYSSPEFIDAKRILSFWITCEIPATEKNCSRYSEIRSYGLGMAIEKKVLLNLSDLSLSETGETRCSSRQ